MAQLLEAWLIKWLRGVGSAFLPVPRCLLVVHKIEIGTLRSLTIGADYEPL